MNAKAAQSAPPEHHGTDLATTPPQPLTLQQRAMAALGERDEVELQKLAAGTQDITVITNAAGYQQVHSARMVLKNKRISIEKDAKKARQDAIDFGKAVIIEERRLIDILAGEETRLEKLQTEWDEARKREKEAKEAAERARIAAIQERIDWIREQAAEAVGQPSAVIQERIETLVAYPIDGTFAELEKQAEGARATTLIRLRAAHANALKVEEAQRKLEEERAELERQKQAEAARQAEERKKLEAAQRLAKEELERERLRQQAAADLERARIAEEERVAKVAREAEAARQSDENDRIRRENAARAQAETERLAAEEAALQARIDSQRAETRRLEQEQEARAHQQDLEDAARAGEASRLKWEREQLEREQKALRAEREKPTPLLYGTLHADPRGLGNTVAAPGPSTPQNILKEMGRTFALPGDIREGSLAVNDGIIAAHEASMVDEHAPESASVAEAVEEPFRPTDEAIVHLVMTTYSVSVPTAIQWLQEMDFETVGV